MFCVDVFRVNVHANATLWAVWQLKKRLNVCLQKLISHRAVAVNLLIKITSIKSLHSPI